MKKAVIAMSGGVDSSVAAKIMKSKGFDCIGITMKLFDGEFINEDTDSACCSADDSNCFFNSLFSARKDSISSLILTESERLSVLTAASAAVTALSGMARTSS